MSLKNTMQDEKLEVLHKSLRLLQVLTRRPEQFFAQVEAEGERIAPGIIWQINYTYSTWANRVACIHDITEPSKSDIDMIYSNEKTYLRAELLMGAPAAFLELTLDDIVVIDGVQVVYRQNYSYSLPSEDVQTLIAIGKIELRPSYIPTPRIEAVALCSK